MHNLSEIVFRMNTVHQTVDLNIDIISIWRKILNYTSNSETSVFKEN